MTHERAKKPGFFAPWQKSAFAARPLLPLLQSGRQPPAHLTRYIHLNPVRAKLVDHPADWPYSSYSDYIGIRNGTLPQTEFILSQFASPADYRDFVEGDNDPLDITFKQRLASYAVFD